MKTYLLTTAILISWLAEANAGPITMECPQGDDPAIVVHEKDLGMGNLRVTFTTDLQATENMGSHLEYTNIPIGSSKPITVGYFDDKLKLTLKNADANPEGKIACIYETMVNGKQQFISLIGTVRRGKYINKNYSCQLRWGRTKIECVEQPHPPQ